MTNELLFYHLLLEFMNLLKIKVDSDSIQKYVTLNYDPPTKLCYIDTDSLALNFFTEYFFEEINNDVEKMV